MRNLLLAGVALGAVAAFVSATPARADDPAAVFPVTSETDLAGWNGPSLNGAAPGSVQVNLGGRTFSALWFQNNPSGTPSYAKATQPQFEYYFFLYPGFDYTSPSGVHFGAQAEIRVTSTAQGQGAGANLNSPVPFFHEAKTYVSSPQFGKVEFGIPNGALVDLAVGTGDDFGTGLFFGWYGTNPYVPWVMADARDNYIATQKIVYTTPTFGGFTAGVSFQPSPISLSWSGTQTMDSLQAPVVGGANPLLSKNRVELAARYVGTFSGVGVKADVGYVFANAERAQTTVVGQDVSYGNFGAQLNYAGFELEGSISTGKYNMAIVDNGNPNGPLAPGAKGTTAYVAGLGYQTGPIKFGGVYYGANYDASDLGGTLGATGHISGIGVGGSYTVGPGVVTYLDFITASFDTANPNTNVYGTQHPLGLGIGTFFTW